MIEPVFSSVYLLIVNVGFFEARAKSIVVL